MVGTSTTMGSTGGKYSSEGQRGSSDPGKQSGSQRRSSDPGVQTKTVVVGASVVVGGRVNAIGGLG